ncbi:glycosyltransferase [Haploplasma axanthum]|uniref:Capsular glucan synthase n=1 Tax=Haploplasma axanthum TaxID=29552 RepID=A0A449BC25_HAPAX|nr:glycosyltransferase [Haploplasma axanthum]VEU79986.1 Capsular glucan synthase [Haploplasma axanthum]
MRVLQINSVCGFGSTGKIMVDIHNLLIENGHESLMFYGRNKASGVDEKYAKRFNSKLDILYHTFLTRFFDKHGFGSKRSTRKMIKEIEKFNPDIIHIHNIHGYYLNIELLFNYFKKSKRKIVWTFHDCWPFTGHCAYFDYPSEGTHWENGMHTCHTKKSYPKSSLFDREKKNMNDKKRIFSNVDDLTIVTPSNWLKDLVNQSYLKQYNALTIRNGIDLNVYKPIRSDIKEILNIKDKRIILGVASGWEERKGLHFFLELSKLISKEEIIILVGVTTKQISDLPNNIIGIQRTNSMKELAELYTAADVFVNPTLEDNYPTTNLEAQACGTKVVTFKTGGSPEGIFNSNGIVTSEKNSHELYEAIKTIFNDKDQVNVQMLAENIDKYILFKKYIDLYKRIINI